MKVLYVSSSDAESHAADNRDNEVQTITIAHLDDLSHNAITLDDIQSAANDDQTYLKLVDIITHGFPETRHSTDPNIREYWEVRNRLSSANGIVFLDKRIVIPRQIRKQVLEHLHSAHQGINGMKARANQCVYWPGMTTDIKNYRISCQSPTCNVYAPSHQAEQIILTQLPDWPFQSLCTDYFFIEGHSYLVVVDRFSAWICIYYFKPGEATSKTLIDIFRDLFTSYGAPDVVSSDGGPQFTAQSFQDFLKCWGVHHRLSSVGYAQSNGRAEAAVKTAKRIIRDNVAQDGSLNNDKVARSLLQYRNTPLQDIDLSPAQILFHRQLRDALPSHPTHYQLHPEWLAAAQTREETFHKKHHTIAAQYNQKTHQLPVLSPGTFVLIQGKDKKWRRQGQIVDELSNRQYRIRLLRSGRISLCNRRFLRKCVHINMPPYTFTSTQEERIKIVTPDIPQPVDQTNLNSADFNCPPAQQSETITPQSSESIAPQSLDSSAPETPQPEHLSPQCRQNLQKQYIPRALKCIRDFNKPGLKE